MQEWTNSGTPVPAIGEAQVLLGTPLVGWGGTIEVPPAPPAVTEPPTATAEAAAQPQENGNPEGENDDELLIPLEEHSTPGRWLSSRVAYPSDPDPGNEAVLVQVAPLVLSRVVCLHSVSRVVGMYSPHWFVIKTCLCLFVCYVLVVCLPAGVDPAFS
jgi:hypothetical protein